MTSRANLNGEHAPRRAPPAQSHHQHYYPATSSSSSSASFKGCCCCLFLLFSLLALLILAVVLVIILAVKPKKPSFDLQQVGVQYMGITTPNPSAAVETSPATNPTTSASLSLNIRMLFTAVNPNRVGIKYGESRFTVMYRGIPLGKASVPGFFQEAHSVRQVEATIAVDHVNLLQADAASLVRDASLNDRVELRVLGDVGAKIRVLNFDSPGVQPGPHCSGREIFWAGLRYLESSVVFDSRPQLRRRAFLTRTNGPTPFIFWATFTSMICIFPFYGIWGFRNSARFLWKSIPAAIKESQPELVAVWKIGQKLWTRDYGGVHEAIRGFDWSQEVEELYRKRMFQLLLSAYSTIGIQDTALFLGMNEDDVTNYVIQQGWVLDPASRMLTVTKQTTVTEQKLDASKLQRLTEYVFHLEH
ncbi:COP9 signalosome complex subunit 8 [Morella rubra]|uniref:COP9 signalosome complex subunit 8 n=1 Tax=Morella rubra TaxID=262757 RepID=A0A6A1WD80_9ROSI|nr:COP9 signalosome complex subunit 8 [Morella rubra]